MTRFSLKRFNVILYVASVAVLWTFLFSAAYDLKAQSPPPQELIDTSQCTLDTDRELLTERKSGKPVTGIVAQSNAKGDIEVTSSYRNGKLDGARTYWLSYPKLPCETEQYVSGVKQGLAVEYWNKYLSDPFGEDKAPSLRVATVQRFSNNQLDGESKSWFYNGVLRSSCNFKKGKLEGVLREWFETGELRLGHRYSMGELDGESHNYWPLSVGEKKHAGRIYKQTIICRNGIMLREESIDRNGNLLTYGEYKDGNPWNGSFLETFRWGNICEHDVFIPRRLHVKTSYSNGKKHGISVWYGADGNVLCSGLFQVGKMSHGSFIQSESKHLGKLVTYDHGAIQSAKWYWFGYTFYGSLSKVAVYLQGELTYKNGKPSEGTGISRKETRGWTIKTWSAGKVVNETVTRKYSDPASHQDMEAQ